ncbi:hypothetical protein R4Z10_17630 [Niallia sp. XMNu-256]|uniref:hypothetical protein n=1 Tax=Niallia sp. XMNu-256 TaxID=3082444 RepID=UPI0030CDE4A0
MYTGRDMTELSMMAKSDWQDNELTYFHHSFQQTLPYLNVEGQSIYREIVEEITNRGGLKATEASLLEGPTMVEGDIL